MIRAKRLVIVALAAAAVVPAATGCGSDSSGDTAAAPVSIPAVTAPQITTSAPAATTSSTTATTKGGKSFDPNQPDSPTNDVPPPPGSPQEAFEQQCKQHPAACG